MWVAISRREDTLARILPLAKPDVEKHKGHVTRQALPPASHMGLSFADLFTILLLVASGDDGVAILEHLLD